jgi:hypothetical protein
VVAVHYTYALLTAVVAALLHQTAHLGLGLEGVLVMEIMVQLVVVVDLQSVPLQV